MSDPTASPFRHYLEARFGPELLPIIPPGAALSAASRISPHKLGKIPGKLTREGWVGFAKWAQHATTAADVKSWRAWPGVGVALQGRKFPGLDIDIDDAALADLIEQEVISLVGSAPCRLREGSSRRLLVYRGEMASRTLIFELGGQRHLIEIKAGGAQYVVEGEHRDGGRYSWRHSARPEAGALAEITPSLADELFERFALIISDAGGEITSEAGSSSATGRAPTVSQEGLLAPSLDAIAAALNSVENDLDYDPWISVMAMVKGAAGGDREAEARELFADWSATSGKDDPEDTSAKWASMRAPYRVGWPQLCRWAAAGSGGAFSSAKFEFSAVEDSGDEGEAPAELTAARAIINGYVYREPTGEWVRMRDSCVMKKEVFNDTAEGQAVTDADLQARLAAADGKGPRPTPRLAHHLMKGKARMVQGITYMPSKETLFFDGRRKGHMYNIYREPTRPFAGTPISEDAVAPFLRLVEHVFPVEEHRTFMLDWMSFIAKFPGRKIQFAPVLYSKTQGVGKDSLLKVLRFGIVGDENMAGIAPSRIDGEFNDDWAPKQVVLVTELPSSQKRDLYDKLKDFVASGAGDVSVNPKNTARFSMPNLHCWAFTTNKADALSLEIDDRRFIILPAREQKMQPGLRNELRDFFDYDADSQSGTMRGYHLAGEWMRQREISAAFDPHECLLVTDAKVNMTVATLPGPPGTSSRGSPRVTGGSDELCPSRTPGTTSAAAAGLKERTSREPLSSPASPCR